MDHGPTPLMELLNQRWDEFLKDAPDPSFEKPFRRPVFAPEGLRAIDRAARHHAEANASDPFAWGRVRHYMRQGFLSPADVDKEAHGALVARKRDGVTFAAVLK